MSDRAGDERAVVDALTKASSVVVCGHVNPDGDAIGSVIALTLALRARGCEAVATLADDGPVPKGYTFLEGSDVIVAQELVGPAECFVALDTPSWERLGGAAEIARRASTTVSIDHHHDNHLFATISLVEHDAASTASIVWRLLPDLGAEPTPAIASACYVGLMTDTGRFSYGNTTPRALRDAADMIDAGAPAAEIYREVYERRSLPATLLLGRVLARVERANHGRVAYSWIDDADLEETGAKAEETENLIDAVRATGGVDAVVFFKAQNGEVKISLRSKLDGLDVSAVARRFGGGGHLAAAGGCHQGTLDEAIRAVLAKLPGHSARRGATSLSGILAVDKPAGMTSHDVVALVRRLTGEGRVGHAGTLDPAATGLLVLLVGPCTRLEPFLSSATKSYEATIAFGAETDTDDAEGRTTRTADVPDELFDPARASRALTELLGESLQVPPAYSAIKVAGRVAHREARAGRNVDLAERPIVVHEARLVGVQAEGATWQVELRVSKGTYVRALARDLGRSLGTAAHLSALRRTESGSLSLSQARTLDHVREAADAGRIAALFADELASLGLPIATAEPRAVATGASLPMPADLDVDEGAAVSVTAGGRLLAVYRAQDALLLPEVVLAGKEEG